MRVLFLAGYLPTAPTWAAGRLDGLMRNLARSHSVSVLGLSALAAQPLPLPIAAAAVVYASAGLAVRPLPAADMRALYRAVASTRPPAAALQNRET